MSDTSAVMAVCEKNLEDIQIKDSQIVPRYCPFCHGGQNKDAYTFAVNKYNGTYNCKRGSCGKKGNFRDLCNYFGEDFKSSLEIPYRRVNKVYDRPSEVSLKPLTKEIIEYFNLRCISQKTLEDFKISSDDNGNIVFPFYRDGKLIFEKFRRPCKYKKEDSFPKEWGFKNGEHILFGMDLVSFKSPLYITEGQIDALSLYEAGIHNVVSVPSGVNNMEWISSCWEWIEKFNTFVLFGDNDEPGIEMVNTLINRLGEDKCIVVKDYPDLIFNGEIIGRTCKDANEILVAYGPEVLKDIAMSAKAEPIHGIVELSEVQDIDPTMIPRIYTKIPSLDMMIGGLAEGSLTVWTGKRGEGKSTLAGQLLLNAVQQGYNACAYSGELPAHQFKNWLYMQAVEAKYVGVKEDFNTGKRYAVLSDDIKSRISDWLRGKFFLYDNNYIDNGNQIDSILKVFTMCVRRYNCKLFLVDNMLSAVCASDEEEYRAQARVADALKKFATKYKVHVILVAHPRKTKAGEQINNDDISGNAAITNLADNVIVSEKPNQTVIKNRDFGVTGTIVCEYNPANRRIYEYKMGDRIAYGWNHEGCQLPEVQAIELSQFMPKSSAVPAEAYPF